MKYWVIDTFPSTYGYDYMNSLGLRYHDKKIKKIQTFDQEVNFWFR